MRSTKESSRRQLRFASLDELLADLDRIEAADKAGTLRTTGNWTAGEILTHLAAWIDYGYEGYPVSPPPFFIRWFLRKLLPKMLRDGMKPGVKIPGVKGGTTGAEKVDTAAGIARLRRSLARLATGEAEKYPSPAFGPLSPGQRNELQLRHAELHLSFLSLHESQ